jgi:hypothetical protein
VLLLTRLNPQQRASLSLAEQKNIFRSLPLSLQVRSTTPPPLPPSRQAVTPGTKTPFQENDGPRDCPLISGLNAPDVQVEVARIISRECLSGVQIFESISEHFLDSISVRSSMPL